MRLRSQAFADKKRNQLLRSSRPSLDTTERYMGGFDTSKTEETLRNVFAKKKTPVASDDSEKSKEEQVIELLNGLTPEQIMAVISAINK